MKLFFFILILKYVVSQLNQTNFVLNGDFSLPLLDPTVANGKVATFWNGTLFDLKNDLVFNLGFGQYMDLQKAIFQNGYISQIIPLTQSGIYQLSHLQRARTTNFFYYSAQIYWNNQLIVRKIPNTTVVTTEILQLYGVIGNNQLKFVEVGNDSDNHGLYIDEVKLVLLIPDNITNNGSANLSNTNITSNISSVISNSSLNNSNITNSSIFYGNFSFNNFSNISNTSNAILNSSNNTNMTGINMTAIFMSNVTINNQEALQPTKDLYIKNQLFYVAFILSLLFSHATSVKYLFILLEDLWLYSYDQRNYEGVINEVFMISSSIEQLKFRVLQRYLGWMKYSDYLYISDFRKFNTSSKTPPNLFLALFPYFIYNVPEIVLMCVIMLLIWKFCRRSCIQKHLKRYCFFWWNLFQSLIEGNLSYFVFLAFAHLSFAFNLRIEDKCSIVFTVIFLFLILIYGIAFYFLLQKFIPKNTKQFLTNCKKSIGAYFFIHIISISKGIIKGTAIVFLAQLYHLQILTLSIGQIVIIIWGLYAHLKQNIFKSKSLFCLLLLYEFVFLLLNIMLYLEFKEQNEKQGVMKGIYMEWQKVLVYILIGISILRIVIDLYPLHQKKRKQKIGNQNKEEDLKASNGVMSIEQKKIKVIKITSLPPAEKI